jgi:hypothetical protein
MQKTKPNWTEGKAWLYQGYEVVHTRDGKSVEIHKHRGAPLQTLPKPVTYQDLTAVIDKLRVAAP